MSEISSGTIPAGLRADIMRTSMENKNTLRDIGALYVGTGTKTSITAGEESYEIPVTAALTPGTINYPLVSNGPGAGIEYRQLTPEGFSLNNNRTTIGNGVTLSAADGQFNHLYYVVAEYTDGNVFSPVFYINSNTLGNIYVPTGSNTHFTIHMVDSSGNITLTIEDSNPTVAYLYRII